MALRWPHLRVTSSYSMRYGTATPHRIVERAAADLRCTADFRGHQLHQRRTRAFADGTAGTGIGRHGCGGTAPPTDGEASHRGLLTTRMPVSSPSHAAAEADEGATAAAGAAVGLRRIPEPDPSSSRALA